MLKSAGIISMGGYLPAKEVPKKKRKQFVEYLRKETPLYPEYIDEIETKGHLPGRVETNYDAWESQPWYESWLESLPPKKRKNPFQGTKERRRVPMDPVSLKNSLHPHPMLSSDAEVLAGSLALFNGGVHKDDIDLLLVCSFSSDIRLPLNASLVQHKLGLKNAGAYNVDTCCSSFVTMLEIAMTYVRCGIRKKVLIIASALHSTYRDETQYISVIFGDAVAAAVVGETGEGYDYIASFASSHGDRHKGIILVERTPTLFMDYIHGPSFRQDFITFPDEKLLKEIAVNAGDDMEEVVNKTLEKSGHTAADIDFLTTHQPNHWAPHVWRECLGVPENKFKETYKKYANIANASVPVNFLEGIEEGMVKPGDKVMLASSGVGENHIAVFQRIPPDLIKNNKL